MAPHGTAAPCVGIPPMQSLESGVRQTSTLKAKLPPNLLSGEGSVVVLAMGLATYAYTSCHI